MERILLLAVPISLGLLVGAKLLSFAAHAGLLYYESLGWMYEFVERML